MEISAEIQRKDVAVLNLHLLPRLRSNWIFFAIMAVGMFSFLLVTRKPDSFGEILVAAVAALIGALGGIATCMVVNLVTLLLTIGKKSGVLGVHHYSLSTLGLNERTDANTTLQNWSAIHSIIKLPNYLFFRMNSYLFYIVPRRCFQTSEDFNLFYDRACELWTAARVRREVPGE